MFVALLTSKHTEVEEEEFPIKICMEILKHGKYEEVKEELESSIKQEKKILSEDQKKMKNLSRNSNLN